MKQKVLLSRVIQILFVLAAITGIILIVPFHMLSQKLESRVDETGYAISQAVVEDGQCAMQQFLPEYDHIDKVEILVDSLGVKEGNFKFTLYDKDSNVLWDAVGMFSLHPGVAYHDFPVNLDVEPGLPYYYRLDYSGTAFAIACQERNGAEHGNGAFYINLEEVPNTQAVTKYQYDIPLGRKKTAALCGGLIVLSLFAVIGIGYFSKKKNLIKTVELQTAVRMGLSIFILAAAVYVSEKICFNHIFASDDLDNSVLTAGVLLTAAILIYAVFHIKLTMAKDLVQWKEKGITILQVIFWAFALKACCDFVNAGSNYAQGLALREMCTYFALAVITMFTKKELWNIWNAVYVVLAIIACVLYVRPFIGQGEPYETAIRTAIMFAVAGIIVLSTIYNLLHKRWADFSLPFLALVVLFFALLLLFRNGIIWEIAVVVPFGLYYIRSMNAAQRNQVLHNISNGVALSFVIWIYQSLRYRPFHYFVLVRYEGMFMTVTVAAVYIAMVLAVATCKLWIAYHKDPTLKGIWKQLILFGMAAGFEFLTLSRTGIMTCVAAYVVAMGMHIIFRFKEKQRPFWYVLKYIGYSTVAIICFIPITYTAARTIPAITNEPFLYLGEEFQDSIKTGEPLNSYRYITVAKFLGMSSERILGKTDLNHMTESGKTVDEVMKEAESQGSVTNEEKQADVNGTLEQSGVTVTDNSIIYIDEYGCENVIDAPDYSNGRLAIFKEYLSRLNVTGHAAVAITFDDGVILAHAHNSFIQMAYDCGIITGIVFVLFYMIFGFRSVWYYARRKDTEDYAMLPVVIFATFGIASMVEYVFRPTIPLGFLFLLVIAPLLVRMEKENK